MPAASVHFATTVQKGIWERDRMLDLDLFCNLGTLATVQLLGMASAWLARLAEGSAHQNRCQRLFFFSLIAVGGVTMMSLRMPPLYWLVSAVIFTLMIMVVVCDFSRHRRADPFASGF
jgi:Flp pilus assembly protein TadB